MAVGNGSLPVVRNVYKQARSTLILSPRPNNAQQSSTHRQSVMLKEAYTSGNLNRIPAAEDIVKRRLARLSQLKTTGFPSRTTSQLQITRCELRVMDASQRSLRWRRWDASRKKNRMVEEIATEKAASDAAGEELGTAAANDPTEISADGEQTAQRQAVNRGRHSFPLVLRSAFSLPGALVPEVFPECRRRSMQNVKT